MRDNKLFVSPLKQIVIIAVCMISSFVIAYYLQFPCRSIIAVLLFGAAYFSLRQLTNDSKFNNSRFQCSEWITILIFSILLVISLILGKHIVIEGQSFQDIYNSSILDSYVSPYGKIDIAAFVLMMPAVFVMLLALYQALFKRIPAEDSRKITFEPIGKKGLLGIAVVLFVFWLPYLLVYWPGLLYGDTVHSFLQLFGEAQLTNHQPVIHVLLMKACMDVGYVIGLGHTAGCALYSIIQMSLMALTFSYLIMWLYRRFSLRLVWPLILVAYFGLSPYVAEYTISFWKDPLFSCALVLVSLLIFDWAITKGAILIQQKYWMPLFVIVNLALVFLRNNGIYIVVLLDVIVGCLAIYWHFTQTKFQLPSTSTQIDQFGDRCHTSKSCLRLCCALTAVAVLFIFVTNPVYKAFNILPSPAEESLGVPLNQMARVAALNGDMTQSDQAYMDSMLPLDQYAEVYCPVCIDSFKWNENFNNEPLNQGFWGHWFSMFKNNPKVYFEAWELQTFGFWTINQPRIWQYDHNAIQGGVQNVSEERIGELARFDIFPENLLGSDAMRNVCSLKVWSVPIGVVLWLLGFLTVGLLLSGRKRLVLPLVPSLALLLTLLIAAPIYYWPRYAVAVQFLIPFYLAIISYTRSNREWVRK